jgi:cytoplasmic iron level regulating protein YaaA (DUF328/UPF0246 family)
MTRHIIITACTKNKCTDFTPDGRIVSPGQYLANPAALAQLNRTRDSVLSNPKSAYDPRAGQHYAFDLYVRHPKTQMYRCLRNEGLDGPIRTRLLAITNDVDWYFLSGGFGLLHALELARPYQATFRNDIARKENIPSTLREWKPVLPSILDEILARSTADSIHIFGSKDYVDMVLSSEHYKRRSTVFEVNAGRANDKALTTALRRTVHRLFGL